MDNLMKKHPVIFEIILFAAAMAVALVFSIPGYVLNFSSELNISIGRIVAGILALIIFRKCFKGNRPFAGFLLIIPAFLIVAWNVVYHLMYGMTFLPFDEWTYPVILGLAPAIFEEVIFRGIFINNLKENGKSDMASLFISAIFFGLIHLTNGVGGDITGTLVQTGYAVVIGLVLGAIYIRSKDIISVILLHAVIDISNHIFNATPTSASTSLIIAFCAVLLLMTVYAILVVSRKKSSPELEGKHHKSA